MRSISARVLPTTNPLSLVVHRESFFYRDSFSYRQLGFLYEEKEF